MAAAYVLKRAGQQQFMWNLQGGNNEKILTSELYNAKDSAQTGIASCRVNATIDERYRRLVNTSGAPYFVLRGANNEVIGTSEAYSSTASREAGIASCKLNGPTAPTDDRT